MARKKSTSIRSIAEQCGLSTATVSRALNGSPHVSEDVRRRVFEAAAAAGYQKIAFNQNERFPENQPGSPTVPGQPGSRAFAPASVPVCHIPKIGVILRSPTQDYYINLASEIMRYMRSRHYQVLTISIDRYDDRLPGALDTLYDAGCQGIILISCPFAAIRNHLRSSIPHVWIDCNDPAASCGEICTVQSDQKAAGQLAALLLIGKGCRAPVVLTSSTDSVRSRERCQGFFDEFRRNNIPLAHEDRTRFLPLLKDVFSESREIIRYLIAKEFPFDSVFAISDWRALGAYAAARDLKKKVPEDIHIIGFDGISLAGKSVLNITSIQQNTALLAQTACEQLLHQIRGEEVPDSERHVVIPVDVLEGETI